MEKPTIASLHLQITNQCILCCRLCFLRSDQPLSYEMEYENWYELSKQFIGEGCDNIIISGDEALTKPFVLRLLADIKRISPAVETSLFSNGILLNNLSTDYLNKNVDNSHVSLDGCIAATHNKMRGKAFFSKIYESLIKIKDYQNKIYIAMTIFDAVDFRKNFRNPYKD